MNSGFQKLVAAAVAVSSLAAAPAALAGDSPAAATTTAVTVYVNAHGGSAIAKKANESHARMQKEGWRFVSLEVHAENGDTEGVWITHVEP